MLPKQHRFTNRKEIQAVFRHGKRRSNQESTLWVLLNPVRNGKPWRASVMVGKKLAKSAVIRNKIKRRWRAHLKKYHSQIPSGTDFIIMPCNLNKPSTKTDCLLETLDKTLKSVRN